MPVKKIPEGFHTLTPYLVLNDAANVVAFLKKAFKAELMYSHNAPDGKIGHAQLKIGDSMLMLADANPQHPAQPCSLYMYVENCDAWYESALKAGATSIMKPMDMFYGDRNAGVEDSFGNQWWIATHVEDVPPEELERRAAAEHAKRQKKS